MGKVIRIALIRGGCTLVVLVLCVSRIGGTAEAAEVMESTFDRYLITVITQTPQGDPASEGEVLYLDAGGGIDRLIEKASADFFRSRGLDPGDYETVWREHAFEGLLERGNGLMVRQYRAKVVYRRKDTAAPLPIEEKTEEPHELPAKNRKAVNASCFSVMFCLFGSYLEWESKQRKRKERRKRNEGKN